MPEFENDNANHWRLCKLRADMCDRRFSDLERILTNQISAQDRMTETTKKDLERRLEGMNQFREQLERQTNTFVDKGMYSVEHKIIAKEIEALREWKSSLEGKSSWSVVISIIALLVSAAIGFFAYVK
jgi:hypothetical protein